MTGLGRHDNAVRHGVPVREAGADPAGLTWWQQVKHAFGFTGQGNSQAPGWERVVYRVSGAVILVWIILIYPLSAVAAYSLLVLGTIMLVFFGLSWS